MDDTPLLETEPRPNPPTEPAQPAPRREAPEWAQDPLGRYAQIEAEMRRIEKPEVRAQIDADAVAAPEGVRAAWEKAPGTQPYRVRPGHPSRHLRGTIGFVVAWREDGETVEFAALLPPVDQPALPIGATVDVRADAIEPVPMATVSKRARELADARKRGPQVGLLVTLSEGGAVCRFLVQDGKLRVTATSASPAEMLLAMDRLQDAVVRRHRAPRDEQRVVAPGPALVRQTLAQNEEAIRQDSVHKG